MEAQGFGGTEEFTLEETFVELFGRIVGRSPNQPELKFVCPSCGKKSLSCNIEKGLYHCFRCGFGRGEAPIKGKPSKIKSLPIDLKLQCKVAVAAQKLSEIPPSYREYLKQRGIYNPEKYGLFIPKISLARELREKFTVDELLYSGLFHREENGVLSISSCLGPGRVVIPYYRNEKLVSIKSRKNPFFGSEVGPKYLAPHGSICGSILWHHREISSRMILTEGELKAIVGVEHLFNSMATSGMNISLDSLSYLDGLMKQIERLYIAFDRDNGSTTSFKEAYKIWERHPTKAAIVIFPDFGYKLDLDTFILKFGPEALSELLEVSWEKRLQNAKEISTWT